MSEEVKKEEAVVETPAVEVKKEEVSAAPVVEDKEEAGEDVVIPAEFKALVDQVEKMTVLELHTLVKLLEKKFGVSASAVASAGPAEAAEEKTEFDVVLVSDGGAKIPTMKAVKTLLGLGLKEAKNMVENLPADLKKGVKKEEAEEIKATIEASGAKVEIK
jgi:large subunit ribosomal protein L7/L12